MPGERKWIRQLGGLSTQNPTMTRCNDLINEKFSFSHTTFPNVTFCSLKRYKTKVQYYVQNCFRQYIKKRPKTS